jgi:hypothetical protein
MAISRHFLSSLLLALILIGAGLPVQAQISVEGTWLGYLVQDRRPDSEEFKIRFELKQEGNRVSGTTFIYVAKSPEYRATMHIEGNVYGAVFVFHETRIIAEKHPLDWDWCLKDGRLTLRREGNYWRLEGEIGGRLGDMRCAPGEGMLERLEPIKPETPPVAVQPPAKVEPAKPKPVTPTPTVEAKPKPPVVTPAKPADYGELAGRKIDHQRQITVYQRKLTLYVWDADKVDGDEVSLSYNGSWLLRKHPLTKTKRAIDIQVQVGADNRLILFAENEGSMPPNTASITFFDGKTTRNLNLASNRSTCGALEFVYQP